MVRGAKNRLPRNYVKLHTVSRQQDCRDAEKPIIDESIASAANLAENRLDGSFPRSAAPTMITWLLTKINPTSVGKLRMPCIDMHDYNRINPTGVGKLVADRDPRSRAIGINPTGVGKLEGNGPLRERN